MMARPKKYQSSSFEFYEDTRGFYYLRTYEGEEVEATHMEGLTEWIEKETRAVKQPLLMELSYGSTIADGVQAFIAGHSERFSTADAILISTFAHKLMATFYLRHYKPKLPTRVFNDVFQALDWIDRQKAAR